MKKNQGIAALLVALAGVSWSFAGLLSKFTDWNSLSIVGYRCAIGLFILGGLRRSFKIVNNRGNWIGAFGMIGTSVLFIFANKNTSPANAIVLQYAMTAIVIVMQAVLFKVKLRRLDIAAAVLVLTGVVLCFCQNIGGGKLIGDAAAFASAFTWAIVFLASRMKGADSMSYIYMGCLTGSTCMISMFFDPAVRSGGPSGWIVPTLMGVCFALGYVFFCYGMRRGVSPTVAAVVSNVEPVLSPTWVFLFLGEFPGVFSVIGAAAVLITVTVYSIMTAKSENTHGDEKSLT